MKAVPKHYYLFSIKYTHNLVLELRKYHKPYLTIFTSYDIIYNK